MVDSVSQQKKEWFNLQKMSKPKKRMIVVLGLLFAVFAIGAILAIAYLLPKTPRLKDGSITIGDTTITQQKLDAYAKSIEAFQRANPNSDLGGDVKSIASDDLIMNAALKKYAKQYGQVVSNRDVLKAALIDTTSDQEANNIIDSKLGDANSMARIRNENVAYEAKLVNYVLAIKSLFMVGISIDSPYFNNLPAIKSQAAYDAAKNRLQNNFLPLFKEKLSKEVIAKKADVNLLDNNTTGNENSTQYFNGPVVTASFDVGYRDDGQYYNNQDSTSYIHGNVGQLNNIDEKIATLKNVGDYTPVFASKTGEFVIIRLESKTNGTFNSWQDMLESFKRQYAYDGMSSVISDVSYGTQAFLENTAKNIASFGVDKAYAVDCSQHQLTYYVQSYDVTSQVRIGGTKMNFTSNGYNTCYGSVNADKTTSAKKYVTQDYNCWGVGMLYKKISDPAGYTYKKIRSPNKYQTDDTNNHNGWPDWSSDKMNELGNIYITFLYTKPLITSKPWDIAVDSNVAYITDSENNPTGSTSVAYPHYNIGWTHTVGNSGPNSTDKDVSYYWQNRGDWDNSVTGYSTPTGYGVLSKPAPKNNPVVSFSSSFNDIPSSYVGLDLCRSTVATPGSDDDTDNSGVESGDACVSVIPYNYQLAPVVKVDPHIIQAGEPYTVTSYITNTGSTISEYASWTLTRTVGSGTSQQIGSGTGIIFQPNSTLNISISIPPSQLYVDTDLDPGTIIRYTLSVQPSANGNAGPTTVSDYLVIGVKPKTRILGGDLIVGKDVDTSTSTKGTTTYGSWAEYGIIASGGISGAASGAAFAGPGLATYNSTNPTTSSYLTFANTSLSPGCDSTQPLAATPTGGCYKSSAIIPDIADSFPVTTSTSLPSSLTGAPSGTYSGTGTITITGGNIVAGQSIIINAPTATVNITGDINYDTSASLTSIKDIPQVVIIAKNINIADGGAYIVKNIDAWLIAPGGSINTCYDVAPGGNLSTSVCNDNLVVNGPVMTDHLYLQRTAGSGTGTNSGDPAEVFNLPADAYLWSMSRASQNSNSIQTVYSTELPPRF
jgi:hypothetical protein